MTAPISPPLSTALRQVALDAPVFTGYRPLDPSKRKIRLLHMIRESEFRLHHIDLDDQHDPYCALPYYWGPPGANRPITIDGELVQIRKTLHQFLKSLYRQYGVLVVWLDVLCINQRVVAEQSAQVAMMGDIYRHADRVYAWLGKGDGDIDYAMSSLRSGVEADLAGDNVRRMVARGIEQMFLRPYWTRMWCVQEVVLNRDVFVVCGNTTLTLDGLTGAFHALSEPSDDSLGLSNQASVGRDRDWVLERLQPIEACRKSFAGISSRSPLLRLVADFSDRECSDPRDKFYGLRAMASDGNRLKVDYKCTSFDILVQLISIHNWACHIDWVQATDESRTKFWWKTVLLQQPHLAGSFLRDVCNLFEHLRLPTAQIVQSLAHSCEDWSVLPIEPFDMGSYRDMLDRYKEDEIRSNKTFQEFEALCNQPEDPGVVRMSIIDESSCSYPAFDGLQLQVLVDVNTASGTVVDAALFSNSSTLFELWVSQIIRFPDAPGTAALGPRLVDLLATFRNVGKRHVWTCRVTTGVHISRTLLLLLMALLCPRWGTCSSFIDASGLRHTPHTIYRCECKLPDGVTGARAPLWAGMK